MKSKLALVTGLAATISFSGCVTSGTTAKIEVLNENRKAIDRNTTALLAAGRANVTHDTAPIDAAEQKLGEGSAASDARFKELSAELAKQKQEFQNFVSGALAVVGEAATELVPAGTAAAKVIGIINKHVQAAQTGADNAQQEGEAAKKEAANALSDAQKLVANLKAELAAKEEILKQQAVAKDELQKKDLELAKKEFMTLGTQQRIDLRQELIKTAEEHGVKGAAGMSTEQLLVALSGAGIGLAGLLRTFGRSRAEPKLTEVAATQGDHAKKIVEATGERNELWTDVKDLQAKMAVIDQRTENASVAPVALSQPLLRIEDHERRIGRLETKVG